VLQPPSHRNTTAPEHLQDPVERVIFHSPESGFYVLRNRIREGVCPACGTAIDGIGMSGA